MAAERERLRRVLNRFKKDELPSAVRWLGRREEISKRRNKKDIISSALDDFIVSSIHVAHTTDTSHPQILHASVIDVDVVCTCRRTRCQNMSSQNWSYSVSCKSTCTLGVEFYLLYRYTHTSKFNPVESILIEICQW